MVWLYCIKEHKNEVKEYEDQFYENEPESADLATDRGSE